MIGHVYHRHTLKMSLETDRSSNRPLAVPHLATVKSVLWCALLAVLVFKIGQAEMTVSIGELSATDLLALLLALFSIGLSAAFYFKANDSATQFYNNTYTFTKEMSELLGRMEEGFGARLQSLDKGYDGIAQKMDQMQSYREAAARQEETVEAEGARAKEIVVELAEKAGLPDAERERLVREHEEAVRERDLAKKQLHILQEQLGSPNKFLTLGPAEAISRVAKSIRKMHGGNASLSLDDIRSTFNNLPLSPILLNTLKSIGALDDDRNITTSFAQVIQSALQSADKS